VLTAVNSVSEVVVIFLHLILFANTAAFFYSLLGLVSHCFREGGSSEEIAHDGVASKRSNTHAILGLF